MMLLEHDGKELLRQAGIPVPAGILAADADAPLDALNGNGWVVKAQVAVGGRGKAGGVRMADSPAQVREHLRAMLGGTIKGHAVRACRVEQLMPGGQEAYVSISVNPSVGGVSVLLSATGGVDVESAEGRAAMQSATCACEPDAVRACLDAMSQRLSASLRGPLLAAAHRVADAFFGYEVSLIEINPLFIFADGSWVAGDAKVVIDEGAVPRQDALRALIHARAEAYPQAVLKDEEGFDFVVLDREGDIGLITTGAGLTMQLIDELAARGSRAYNFCDIRTAQFRGSPARLIQVMRWIAQGPNVKAVLINFFAGMTDLGEVAGLLVAALQEVKELRVPVTARLIGNGVDTALRILREAGDPVEVIADLDEAIATVAAHSRAETGHA